MKYHFRHPDAAKSRLSLSIISDYRWGWGCGGFGGESGAKRGGLLGAQAAKRGKTRQNCAGRTGFHGVDSGPPFGGPGPVPAVGPKSPGARRSGWGAR